MKKSTIWTIVAVVIIALGGGIAYVTHNTGNNTAYGQAMARGKDAVASKEYHQAADSFEQAEKIKNTSEAQAYKSQANDMLAAISDTKEGSYSSALSSVKNVISQQNGYSVLKEQGQKLKTTISNVKDNYEHEIKPLVNDAEKAEENEKYSKAVNAYKNVLALPYINGKYYAKYKKEAKHGIKRNKQLAKENKTSTPSSSNSNNASSSSGGDTGNAGKTGEGAPGDHTVNGKTVTPAEIKEIKAQVAKAGEDANAWSPQDLIDLYRSSKRTSPSQITKQDIANYLKK
ncbi:hypothetical protein PT285_01850 [Lactobacillus sp. ESL0791]|uniref:hypothetical protein n=1 Tax=Lactobacillus sp. ESL0791 TaxID=2983234 RepID=UPI0023F62AB5|nr:hypothetical protein [Lactobacillus sp. ESL0791]MDF7638181.1 hypothetical protein [Lactobacillus sp. ESL0791]